MGILERAEELTGEGGKVKKIPGGEGQGACTITWTDVVHRLVMFNFILVKQKRDIRMSRRQNISNDQFDLCLESSK